jgi:ribosomal protein S18 acetylase RimI-like enzyme
MKIEKYLSAKGDIPAALQVLIEICAKRDGHRTEIDIDPSMNAAQDMPFIYTYEDEGLKALLSVFAPMRDEIEVSALVHPDYRNKGVFRSLVKETVKECSRFGYCKGLFVCGDLEAGKRVMEHWGLSIDHVELQMSCDANESAGAQANTTLEIRKAGESDIDSLACVGAAAFGMDACSEKEFIKNAFSAENRTQYIMEREGHAVGLCAASENGEKLMIYGLGVHPDERRKGCAQAMLRHMEKEALKRGKRELGLDVDEDNPAAIALYKSFGFTVTGRTEYYSFEFDAFR